MHKPKASCTFFEEAGHRYAAWRMTPLAYAPYEKWLSSALGRIVQHGQAVRQGSTLWAVMRVLFTGW